MTRPVVCHCQCNEMSKINYETLKLGSRLDETLGARARRPNFASSIDSGIRKSVNSDLDSCHSSEVSTMSGEVIHTIYNNAIPLNAGSG